MSKAAVGLTNIEQNGNRGIYQSTIEFTNVNVLKIHYVMKLADIYLYEENLQLSVSDPAKKSRKTIHGLPSEINKRLFGYFFMCVYQMYFPWCSLSTVTSGD